MKTVIHQRIEEARNGQNPKVIARVPSGWAVLGDHQLLPGYSLLLPDPVVPTLNDLTIERRIEFLRDMSLLGDAVIAVTKAARANYEILCNLDPALHAHVFPRFLTEPDEFRTKPVWFYDLANAPKFDFDRDRKVMRDLAQELSAKYEALGLSCKPRAGL